MIKCEVSFTNSMIEVNEYQIIQDNDFQEWDVYKDDRLIESFEYLEQAIKFAWRIK
jgi:hypothetical protein